MLRVSSPERERGVEYNVHSGTKPYYILLYRYKCADTVCGRRREYLNGAVRAALVTWDQIFGTAYNVDILG